MTTVSSFGALVALIVAIFLILKKVSPVYGMLTGGLIGGLVGGADLSETVNLMIGGAQGITTAVMRILAAGVLAGVLIESGAASTIAETITHKLGEARALLALALATLILTAVGVFIDVAVIHRFPDCTGVSSSHQFIKISRFIGDDWWGESRKLDVAESQCDCCRRYLSSAFNVGNGSGDYSWDLWASLNLFLSETFKK